MWDSVEAPPSAAREKLSQILPKDSQLTGDVDASVPQTPAGSAAPAGASRAPGLSKGPGRGSGATPTVWPLVPTVSNGGVGRAPSGDPVKARLSFSFATFWLRELG